MTARRLLQEQARATDADRIRRGGSPFRVFLRIFLLVFIVASGAAAVMFIQFTASIADLARRGGESRADAIVVLTGDSARISKAIELLRAGKGERLLISGVNQRTSRAAIRKMIAGAGNRFDCCVDIDRAALDTVGNARQARLWADRYGYRSIILVTSDYHLPRSLIEFSREMPEVEIIPVSAKNGDGRPSRISDPDSFRRIGPEFLKFMAARFRLMSRRSSVQAMAEGPAE